eukprot:2113132-Amphidinium_carterae.2
MWGTNSAYSKGCEFGSNGMATSHLMSPVTHGVLTCRGIHIETSHASDTLRKTCGPPCSPISISTKQDLNTLARFRNQVLDPTEISTKMIPVVL